MAITRTQTIKGPAKVTYRGGVFFSQGDITLELGYDTFEVVSSAHGKLDERASARRCSVSFTPVGEWEHLGVLWPYAGFTIGKGIFTPVDYPAAPNTGTDFALEIHSVAGEKVTIESAAVTQMPNIDLSAQRTAIGAVTFTGICKDNTDWSASDSLVSTSTSAFAPADYNALSIATIRTVPVVGVWQSAASPWDAIKSVSGFQISFGLQTTPLESDTDGVYDMIFQDVTAECTFQPTSTTEAEIIDALKLQANANVRRGQSMQTLGALTGGDLTLAGAASGDPSVVLTNCFLKQGGMSWGGATPRAGSFTFTATRSFAVSGLPDPLFTVAAVA